VKGIKMTNHAHVEASVIAISMIAIVSLIDHFVNMMDNNPYKLFGYIGLFFVLYIPLYMMRKKAWRR
tara:strand:+ start:5305 stop:5505 length:201 start_codon:yes stop_codon:yes gene_type:complete